MPDRPEGANAIVRKQARKANPSPDVALAHLSRLEVLFLVLLIGLGARVWVMQLVEGEHYLTRAKLNHTTEVVRPALRGDIIDQHGVLLATNRPTYDLVVDRGHYSSRVLRRGLARIAPLVGRSTAELEALLWNNPMVLGDTVLLPNLSPQLCASLSELEFDLPGMQVVQRAQRTYPAGAVGGHVLGYIQEVDRQDLARDENGRYASGDMIGRTGLEAAGEDILCGTKGRMTVRVFANGVKDTRFVREKIRPKAEETGQTLQTHLDLDLQAYCETLLGASEGSIVVLGASGEVFALASNPRLNPNNYTDPNRRGIRENRGEFFGATMGTWEPGSVYKMVVAYGGLSEEKIGPRDTIGCAGHISRGNHLFRCMSKWGHGQMNMLDALQRSCNIYFYTVGERLGVDGLTKYSRAFGLGAPTGIELPNEAGGIIPDQEWKMQNLTTAYHNHGVWVGGETLHSAIGQGFTVVTPLQMAVYTLVIANKGQGYHPTLFARALENGEVVREFPARPMDPLPDANGEFEVIHEGMWRVVNELHGTGYRSRREGLSVCGKTGSAEHHGSKFLEQETHAWFVGFAPRENPRYVVVVLLPKTGHGGEYAAPVAMDVFERLLGGTEKPAS